MLSIKRLRYPFILITVSVIVLFYYGNLRGDEIMTLDLDNFPSVQFNLGDSYEQLQAQSGYQFKDLSADKLESNMIGPRSPHYVEFMYPEHAITFPPGIFFVGRCYHGSDS